MKQLRVQRGTFAGESVIPFVFSKKQTRRPLGQIEGFLALAIHAGDLTIASRL
jgi:hypothetical protein